MASMKIINVVVVSTLFASVAQGVNFPWEQIQLADSDIGNFTALAFGDTLNATAFDPSLKCRVGPGDAAWPSPDEWARFNASLGGALIKTVPLGAVCYPSDVNYNADTCTQEVALWDTSGFHTTDPTSLVSNWVAGDTCDAVVAPTSNCTLGGLPVYVVNATTVKHIQMGVNFARNNALRLVIKNTGHDFGGRSAGAGALSIWTHNLKTFEYIPAFNNSQYQGMAAKVAAGLQAYDLFDIMADQNITLTAPGGTSVGAYGGYAAGGGYSNLVTQIGLCADQIVQLQAVTADGKFVEADSETNSDLFYAMRGGGGGTYGILTSAVVKAYPPITVQTLNLGWSGNSNVSTPSIAPDGTLTVSMDAYWAGVDKYFYFNKATVDAGGIVYGISQPPLTSDGYTIPPAGTYMFSANIILPGMTVAQVDALVAPLYADLIALGIPINSTNTTYIQTALFGTPQSSTGDVMEDTRFATRLFPRTVWDNQTLFDEIMSIRRAAEETGHWTWTWLFTPATNATGGFPDNAVNPAMRNMLMHSYVFENNSMVTNGVLQSPDLAVATHDSVNLYVDQWRALTPGSGAYMNEADVEEPNWQASFFGDKYSRLLDIKNKWDPWGIFWAPTTVGSEGWEVTTADGVPSQNGPLCRVVNATEGT